LNKNEGATFKFVNVSSDAISRNEMHEVSSASTSKSIPEVEEETTPGRIRNNEAADIESNVSEAYAAKVRSDDITTLRNGVSCGSVFFSLFAAAETSANVCVAHETLCKIQVSISLQPHRTVVANIVPGNFGLFQKNQWNPVEEH